ncbi:MAG TPA: methyltransferase domain-containing protein [Acidimicrobiales bacterium]|nr:methyltransferase domain-containing protein [Acidimicrobiales bacterium]
MSTTKDFDELVAEAESVPVKGWDFSWFRGRATEQRPSWGYSRLLVERVGHVDAAMDIETGGGEVFTEALENAARLPRVVAATESWPPNLEIAGRRLAPFRALVVRAADEGPLPFRDRSFDLVVSRHPIVTVWEEIARVLRTGGSYLSQQVGAGSNRELYEFMMGPQPPSQARSPRRAVESAKAAGLIVVDLRQEPLETVFDDVGAVVYFLRKVVWTVPGFTVEKYRDRLRALHEQIERDGPFVAYAQRFLIEAKRP